MSRDRSPTRGAPALNGSWSAGENYEGEDDSFFEEVQGLTHNNGPGAEPLPAPPVTEHPGEMEGPAVEFGWSCDSTFVDWVTLLKMVITDDVQLYFDQRKGVYVDALDQFTHIGFVRSNLKPSAFAFFHVRADRQWEQENSNDPEKQVKLAIDLNGLSAIGRRIEKDDKVRVLFNEKDAKLEVKIVRPATPTRMEIRPNWDISTIKKEYEHMSPPEGIAYTGTVRLFAQQFFQMLQQMFDVDPDGEMSLDKAGVHLSARSSSLGSVSFDVRPFEDNGQPQLAELVVPEDDSPAHLFISLKLLLKVGHIVGLAKWIQVNIMHEEAIYLHAEFEGDRGLFEYWQAGKTLDRDI